MGNGFVRNNINQFAVVYRFVDFLIIQLTLLAACNLYGVPIDVHYHLLGLIGSTTYLLSAELFWLYRSWRSGTSKELIFYTVVSWFVSTVVVLSYLFLSKTSDDYSRVALSAWVIVAPVFLCSWRMFMRAFLYHVRKKGFNSRSVGIIGMNENAVALANELKRNPHTGFRIDGIFDDRDTDRLAIPDGMKVEGSINDAIAAVRNGEFDQIFITLPMTANKRIEQILHQLGDTNAEVHFVPNFFMYNMVHSRLCNIGNLQTISVFDTPMRGATTAIKRAEDIFLATCILAVIAVPMLFIAAAVKLTSKGPVIFKQNRYGVDGKKIKVWKFRSMTVTEDGDKVTQATKGDARITKVGAFLRRTSLDELPQFINVLQGSMSVVGPRPHAVAHNEMYRKTVKYYMLRHRIKPGITGWAQVNGWRGETDTVEKMQMRVQYDLEYIRNWSLWLDFKIVIFTFFKGFVGKNVY
ncbi:undecaprenyl-phosphate glucose phosphotransferase [Alteromonas sp. RKMC-009]|uniref:undecaprenyl-phosphate glucose phosphotransferase n=1 Tax=Alteromonas sp. RKMC-009 TaxID=2267264 RepID=UPI000E69E610|nr:undecaprenyl-phosphate glucose phosphotransferase [Alteromonas sp. RKMC-009]AYA63339.1 undecaprenyl-phosphate glucose phosphotransferase [Alteromonas sp. RKMC-009]MEC7692377.1 undecaprenyl-phosphate glucose phosphotransferase [Pseudomonadota bacterium]